MIKYISVDTYEGIRDTYLNSYCWKIVNGIEHVQGEFQTIELDYEQ